VFVSSCPRDLNEATRDLWLEVVAVYQPGKLTGPVTNAATALPVHATEAHPM
jgi:hypothetical protein